MGLKQITNHPLKRYYESVDKIEEIITKKSKTISKLETKSAKLMEEIREIIKNNSIYYNAGIFQKLKELYKISNKIPSKRLLFEYISETLKSRSFQQMGLMFISEFVTLKPIKIILNRSAF